MAYADAVLHVRISADEPDGSDERGDYPHRASAISAVKTPGGRTLARLVVRQDYLPLFDVGQEMIVFLKSAGPDASVSPPTSRALATAMYPAMALLVQNGRITQAPPEVSHSVGMATAAVLKELRGLVPRR